MPRGLLTTTTSVAESLRSCDMQGVRPAVVIAAGATLTTTAAMSAAATTTAATIAAEEQHHSTNTSRIASVRARVGERARSSEQIRASPASPTFTCLLHFTMFSVCFLEGKLAIFHWKTQSRKFFFACGALRNGSLRSPGPFEKDPLIQHPRHPGPPRRYPGVPGCIKIHVHTAWDHHEL